MVLYYLFDTVDNARVAQRWSISLPRRGSRVRSPSRALFIRTEVLNLSMLPLFLNLFGGDGGCVMENNNLEKNCELNCNVDDMTGEAIGFAMDRLYEAGALEVFTVPVGMKKCRPGILIHIVCREKDKESILHTVFKYTTTIGIRENLIRRYALENRIEMVETAYGDVRCKISNGYGVERRKYEYDDLSRIAKENGESIETVLKNIEKK